MSRTSCVALMGGSVFIVSLLGGCTSCTVEPPPNDTGPRIFVEAGPDARDAGNDPIEINPPSCSASGAVGGHCRSPAACAPGATCVDLHAGPQTINDAFRLRQSSGPDPAHLDYPLATATVVSPAPFHAAEGTLCAQQCNTSVADACGACTTCSDTLTQMPLVAVLGGARQLFGTGAMFGASTGVCRIDCTFDPATPGDECPASTTCDAFGGTCVEACSSDAECNTNLGITYAGELVTVVDTAPARTCNVTTGRCEHAGATSAHVGDACTSEAQCASGTGLCLSGGHCAELGCASPNMATSTCDGTRGICLSASESSRAQGLCLPGCNHASDCGPGNTCNLLWADAAQTIPFPIGTFAGYCIGACTSDDACNAGETCTDTTTGTTVNAGRCVPRCMMVGAIGATAGCPDAQVCIADHVGATYGSCDAVDRFCGDPDLRSLPAASTDCATGWVCDELLAGVTGQHETLGDGHCAPACTSDTDCTGRGTCVTSGIFAGLCRTACTSDAACTAPQVCDTTAGWCVEGPPPTT